MPDGLPVVGLFGGVLVLAGLSCRRADRHRAGPTAPVALVAAAAIAFGVVVGSGVVLVRRLRHAAAMLEQTVRQVEEAGSRLQVLVEHVPAAVYIDMADPDVSDGGRLAYMSPQISGHPRLSARGARGRSRALAEPDPPG